MKLLSDEQVISALTQAFQDKPAGGLMPEEFRKVVSEMQECIIRKPVKGYEGHYEVDEFGRIYSINRIVHVSDNGREYEKLIPGRQMKQSLHTGGYKIVSLTINGKTKTFFVHRIVAEAFVPNPNNYPIINHKDEDKTNNFADNLEWCTIKYNSTYGKAREKQAKKIRGKKHTKEHNEKIRKSLLKHYAKRRTDE